jgi:hypothetical protein
VAGFKKCHGIKGFVHHGEAVSADNAEETKARNQEIKDNIATYNLTWMKLDYFTGLNHCFALYLLFCQL